MKIEKTRNEKLENLIHYIVWKCENPTKLGATKLNKILWYADAIAYLQTGESITGDSYKKRQFGPVPAHVLAASEWLKDDGKIAITEDLYFNRPQKQFVALTQPNISDFRPEDISNIDGVIEKVCDKHTAASISELSHDIIWEAAEIGEEIPLYAVYASRMGEITKEDLVWANECAQRVSAA